WRWTNPALLTKAPFRKTSCQGDSGRRSAPVGRHRQPGRRDGLSVGSSRAATLGSPVFVQVRAGYPTYPTRCQHEGDGKHAGQSTKSLKSPIAPCHCIHVGDSETSPPIHAYISFPTRDIVTYGGYVGFCLLTCTFMGCA